MRIATTLLFLGLTLCSARQATAAEYPEIMFILDSSGSMSEVVAGKTKIDAAKEVMHKLVPELDSNVRAGLTAYGHRSAGDCADIEVLLPPGSTDRAELLARVDQLQPKGKTPISAAILTVASKIKMKDAETTIVLVSDGIETCGGNPCEVVAQLKSTGAKFVLHTVGFDVNAAAAQQLQCAAQAGEGRYFSAGNADELLEAMRAVNAEVLEKVQEVAPAVATTRAVSTKLGRLRVTMPVGSEVSLANVKIENALEGKRVGEFDKPKADSKYPLRAGDYRISLGFATPSYGRPTSTDLGLVSITGGDTKELKLGSISFNLPKTLADEISVDSVLIADAGNNETVVTVRKNGNSYYHFKPKPVVGGVYNVLFRYSVNTKAPAATVARSVTVEPGKDTVVTLDSAIQVKQADGLIGWELVPTNSQTADSREDGEDAVKPAAALSVVVGKHGQKSWLWKPYIVTPGTYDILVHIDGMDEPLLAGESVEISEGDLLRFDAGL